ncbi:Mitochondrial transcription termination factor family protein [Euphorbia peplus]|nr:Mitochondrial transcription termination factor family protein [Euphorbia peplus]
MGFRNGPFYNSHVFSSVLLEPPISAVGVMLSFRANDLISNHTNQLCSSTSSFKFQKKMHPVPGLCRIPSLKCSLNLHKFPIFSHISRVSFSTCTPKISIFDYLVDNHQFSPEFAAKVSSLSSTKYLNKPQNADSFLNFLKENGFSKKQIQVVIQKVPGLLSSKLETSVKPKIKVFQDLGFPSSDFARIISSSPTILRRRPDWLRQNILGLKNVLGPHLDVSNLSRNVNGRVFEYDLNETLVPNVEYLKSCGICPSQIATYVCRAPLTYAIKPEKFKDIVQRVDEMGVDRKSKVFIEAFKAMSCMSRESWELKLQVFRELGFSEQNILVAFRRVPAAFGSSERKIKEATQLLLNFEDISYIARNPSLLGYSVEKRLKPRLRVLKALQSKNLLKKKPCLALFVSISNAEFMKKYVSAHSEEIGRLYAVSKSL